MGRYIAARKVRGTKYFPLVLMLEPLHACNLHCSGCGRVREYADTAHLRMSLDECLGAVEECGAPTVSICGGEPLIYPEIIDLVDRTLALGKHIYLCTNGQLLAEKIDRFTDLGKRNRHAYGRLFWNVHLDGMEATHDRIVEKPGAFAKAVDGIQKAKKAGFRVYTNTTLYKNTGVDELVELGDFLAKRRVDGLMIAPAYGYEAVRETLPIPENGQSESFFLTRKETHARFREIRERMKGFRLTATPIFLDFLCGDLELPCAAWANPTRNVKGWKGPCYLVTDKHFATYRELIEQTDWNRIGPGKDPRCEHCLMHCGFEPAAVLCGGGIARMIRMAVWQMG